MLCGQIRKQSADVICSMYQSDEKGITRTALQVAKRIANIRFDYKLDISNKSEDITTKEKKSNAWDEFLNENILLKTKYVRS